MGALYKTADVTAHCRAASRRRPSGENQTLGSGEKRGFPCVLPISEGAVDGGVNPRKSGDDRKSGTRFAVYNRPLLAIYRSDANGCPVALCQRRQPPKAGAVGQRLQRVAGQPSLTIKSDGWFPVAAGLPDP